AFECEVSTPASLARHFYNDFTDKFLMRKIGGVGVLDEIGQCDGAFSFWPKATDFSLKRLQYGCPVAAWVRLGERTPDGSAVANLDICDASGTVVQDRNFSDS